MFNVNYVDFRPFFNNIVYRSLHSQTLWPIETIAQLIYMQEPNKTIIYLVTNDVTLHFLVHNLTNKPMFTIAYIFHQLDTIVTYSWQFILAFLISLMISSSIFVNIINQTGL